MERHNEVQDPCPFRGWRSSPLFSLARVSAPSTMAPSGGNTSMLTGRNVLPVQAVVHRDPAGNWVMSWPGGYAYDFWTDAEAAERAARVATELLRVAPGEDPELIDEQLCHAGLLFKARVRRRVGPGLHTVRPDDTPTRLCG